MSKVKFGAEAWNERFRGDGWAYGKEPNAWLAQRIKPGAGKALVPADGEGRNAFGFAAQGYTTTVFDLSDVGREKCALLAKERGVEVRYEVDDLVDRDFPTEYYELIACSWFRNALGYFHYTLSKDARVAQIGWRIRMRRISYKPNGNDLRKT